MERMKQFLKIKREKSPKPPLQPTPPRNSADVAPRPSRFQAEQFAGHEDDMGSQTTFRVVKDGHHEHPALQTPVSGVLIGDIGNRDGPMVQGAGNTREEVEPAEASSERAHRNTFLRDAKEASERFSPLKAVLRAIPVPYSDGGGSNAMGKKIEVLMSHVVLLEEWFDSRPGDVAELGRRNGLISEFKSIEGQLSEKLGLQPLTKKVKEEEAVFGLLEDLQKAIFHYQMARRTSIDDQGFKSIDPAEATILNNFRYARQAEYRHSNRSGCLKGTRSTVLDEIELWTRDFDKPPIYWLNGLAGTGKTTIAQTIAERMFADGRLGASFFCSRDFEDRRNLQLIFPTLAVQLARTYPAFRSIFVPLVQSDPEIFHESLYGQMNKLIVQPLVKSAISTVIVIDALDECRDTEPASAILFVLGQLMTKIPKAKFFVTGRPEPRIQDGFRLSSLTEVTDVFVLHEVQPRRVNSDIRLFFRHNFLELGKRRHGLDDWPTEQQLDLLCERAAGLFVYAMATIRFIDQKNRNPKKQLGHLLQSLESGFEGKTKLTESATLDSLYMSILQEAFNDNDPEDGPDVRSVLGAVILATNPLSPSTIAILLGFDAEDVSPLLSSVHSLLILQEDIDRPVRPFHKSFPDFIVNPARCTNPRFCVCPFDQHSKLLAGCLDLLNRTLEQNMCQLPDGVTNAEVDDLKERTEIYINKALVYACRSWHKHLIAKIPARTLEILHRFLKEKFLFWLEVLSVIGAVREAVYALEAAAKWLDVSPTLDLVKDYSRFIITFFDLISTSAPHIYISALPLSPRTSIVRETYKKYACPFVRVVHGLPASWEPVIATAHHEGFNGVTAWSPCNRFIAVGRSGVVEIRDAVTLMLLNALKSSSSPTHLRFSPDSRLLTQLDYWSSRLVTWDLQTGGSVDATFPKDMDSVLSSTYSMDGKVLAVVYSDSYGKNIFIATHDLSTSRTNLYRVPEGRIAPPIWTHGEFLRFAILTSGYIAVWEGEFSLTSSPKVVESLSVPDEIVDKTTFNTLLFLPAPPRLAIALLNTLVVWDARDSKLLLRLRFDARRMSFSSDGRLFACTSADTAEVHVWKESPSGYILHQKLATIDLYTPACLSPNGESIIISPHSKIHLRHTQDPIISSRPTLKTDLHSFVLGFSPNGALAAFVRYGGKSVVIIDLHSGDPQLEIDAGMEVRGLGVTGSTVVVVSKEKVVTWTLAAENSRVDTDDSVQITMFNRPPPSRFGQPFIDMSVSPDLSRIVTLGFSREPPSTGLEIHDVSTGRCLVDAILSTGQHVDTPKPWFTPDGREIWTGSKLHSTLRGWQIIEDRESAVTKLQPLGPIAGPSGPLPWQSSCDYEITDNGWILSSTRKRLLWLPHRWRSDEKFRMWNGRLLGLRHAELPEIVILEFLE